MCGIEREALSRDHISEQTFPSLINTKPQSTNLFHDQTSSWLPVIGWLK